MKTLLLSAILTFFNGNQSRPQEDKLVGTVYVYQSEEGDISISVQSRYNYCVIRYLINKTFSECDSAYIKGYLDSIYGDYRIEDMKETPHPLPTKRI